MRVSSKDHEKNACFIKRSGENTHFDKGKQKTNFVRELLKELKLTQRIVKKYKTHQRIVDKCEFHLPPFLCSNFSNKLL